MFVIFSKKNDSYKIYYVYYARIHGAHTAVLLAIVDGSKEALPRLKDLKSKREKNLSIKFTSVRSSPQSLWIPSSTASSTAAAGNSSPITTLSCRDHL